jgi:hypothetical protein
LPLTSPEAEQSAYQGLTNTPLLIRVRAVSGDSGLPEPTSELADPHPGRTLWHRPTRAIRGSRTRQRILTENETSRRLLPDSATLRRGEPWSVLLGGTRGACSGGRGPWTEAVDKSPSVARGIPRLLAGYSVIRAVAEGPPICRG